MIIQCLTHVPFEDAANIAVWANNNKHTLKYTHLYEGQALPDIHDIDMLAVMGGPMNIYEEDQYPWLADEKAFIKETINAGKKIIGICLGAQLIADALGAEVTPNKHKEIGWFDVKLTSRGQNCDLFTGMPATLNAFHWHGDTFEIPRGTLHLASSRACDNQAFLYDDRILALQFHIEYSKESIEKMLTNCSDELVKSDYIQTSRQIRNGYQQLTILKTYLFQILDHL